MTHNKTVLFTTVYPEGAKYLKDWYSSVKLQDIHNFDIWIGCDRLSVEQAQEAMESSLKATWIIRKESELPIQFRERAIEGMIEKYSIIIFVDSDDILEPSRVRSAQNALKNYDVYGCSMRIIDEPGNELPIYFKAPKDISFSDLLIRNNIFGLSNTAYRSEILRNCLPFPKECILLDWFIVTRALLNNAKLYFDDDVRMKYRQHATNTARILSPFSNQQIINATKLVLQHYDIILKYIPELCPYFKKQVPILQDEVILFYDRIIQYPDKLDEYTERLNKLTAEHIWWSCVAHPDLEDLWKQ